MEELRKTHNEAKRTLIQSVTESGNSILDVGCGFGGDLQKWHKCGANMNMCDPVPSALEEARSRARNMHLRVNFYEGDIHGCPNRKHDIVCYNFSLHYIFATRDPLSQFTSRNKEEVETRWEIDRNHPRLGEDNMGHTVPRREW